MRFGLDVQAGFHQRGGQVAVGLGIVWRDGHGLAKTLHGFVVALQTRQQMGEVRESRGKPRVMTHGLLVGFEGCFQFATIPQSVAQVEVRPGVVGPQGNGPAKRGDRLGVLALSSQGDTQVVLRLGKIRGQFAGPLEPADGFGQLRLSAAGFAQIVGQRSIARSDLHCPTQAFEPFRRTTRLAKHHAQQVQGIAIVGLRSEQIAAGPFGLVKGLGAKPMDGELETGVGGSHVRAMIIGGY